MEDYINLIDLTDVRQAGNSIAPTAAGTETANQVDQAASESESFLYVVSVDEDISEMNQWEGQVGAMKKQTE